ncbi:TPA: hypothetical protein N0F65_012099 [Lagenidium giganteum]|uniref:Uncharacterized protein n=1 Tax=Lagenidium giganteum TaxID=4803 RepID=A0AAV2YPJ6_9STRA|nr:TPA: hypothetical protein N0F65_012099 [Lagenidium giganteum]
MAMAMRRDVPKERVFFLVVLSCSLLLFSVVLLRGEVTPSSRTFRDGFTVANRDLSRRTESLTSNSSAPNGSTNATDVVVPKGAALEVSNDQRLTTITTEDGDEITIKHAANSKNKITTISAHDDGKITIQNVDKPVAALAAGEVPDVPKPTNPTAAVASENLVVVNSGEKAQDVFAAPADEATADDSDKPKSGKKVTVVHVSRQLTRVLLEDADEEDHTAQAAPQDTVDQLHR